MPKKDGACVDRAKQFIPFAALTGYYELIADVTRYREDKRDMLADHQDELESALQEIECGDRLKVVHYKDETYTTTIGELSEIREADRVIVIDGHTISCKDILDIEYWPSDIAE